MKITINTADFFRSTENEELSDSFINILIQHRENSGNSSAGCPCCGDKSLSDFLTAIIKGTLKINASQQAIENLIIFTADGSVTPSYFEAFEKLIRGRKFQWNEATSLAIAKLLNKIIEYQELDKKNAKDEIEKLHLEILRMEKFIKSKEEKIEEYSSKINSGDSKEVMAWKNLA